MQEKSTTIERIREAQDAIASAQSAMDKAQTGLSGAESIAENVERARRHPITTATILFALGLAATLTFMGLRNSDDG